MELHQLRTLIHVAELGSLSKAANRLGIAQPALSRQIRMLEEELGGALFERHGRGMKLTLLGRQILELAGEIMNRLSDIRRLAEPAPSVHSGRVRLGMTPTVSEIMAVPLALKIKEEQPRISLCLTSAFSGHLLDWLKRDEIDFCVSYDPDATQSVRSIPILRETMMLVGDTDSGLSMTERVAFRDLGRRKLILPSPPHGLRQIIERCAAQVGISVIPEIEVDSLSAMVALIRTGFGCTILPLASIYDDVRKGGLRCSPLVAPTPSRLVALTFPADRHVLTATRYVGEVFQQVASRMVETGVWSGDLLPTAPLITSG